MSDYPDYPDPDVVMFDRAAFTAWFEGIINMEDALPPEVLIPDGGPCPICGAQW